MKKKNIILIAVMAAIFMPVIVSCGSKERLYIYNWTYYTPDSIIEKFEKEYNVRVVYDEFASNEDMYAKLLSTTRKGLFGWLTNIFGRQYDVVFPSCYFISMMKQENLLEKIDHSKAPNLKNIDPEILQKAVYDPEMEYAVPYYYNPTGIIVNTARVPNFERSWSIFAREDLRNKMTMLDDMREVLGGALLFSGYSVNTTSPEQIKEAQNLVNSSWKPNLVKFDSESFGKGYANGDFWVVHAYAEVVFEEILDNEQLLADTVFFIPEEGSPACIDNMCILKGSNNIDLAHKFIDFIHRPDIYAEFVDTFSFPSTVNIPARQLKKGGQMYSVEDMANTELIDHPGPALEYYSNAWFNSIRSGK